MRWGPPQHPYPPNLIILQLGHSPRYFSPVPQPLQRNDRPRRKSSPIRIGLASHWFDETHRAYLVFVLCLIEWRTMEAILVFVLRLIWGCVCVWGYWVFVMVVVSGWWWGRQHKCLKIVKKKKINELFNVVDILFYCVVYIILLCWKLK